MRKLWLIFSQTATICLAALLVVSTLRPDLLNGMPQGTIITTVKQTAGDATAPRPSSYSDAARKAMPAVVNIFTSQAVKAQQHPLRDDPLFRFFFGDQPDAHRGLCVLLCGRGEAQTALQHGLEALRLRPGWADAHNCLGVALSALSRLDEAVDQFRRALQAEPGHASAHVNLGNALIEQGSFDAAIEHYVQAVALDPENSTAHLTLAMALEEDGRYADALASYGRAQALAPNDGIRIKMATLLPLFPRSSREIDALRERLDREIAALTARPLRLRDPAREVGQTAFLLPYQGRNDRDLQVKLAALYEHACPDLLYTAPHCRGPGARRPRLRVGFASGYFRAHSVGIWFNRLIALLAQNPQFEVVLVDLSGAADAELRAACARYVAPAPDLALARGAIAREELDVLVYADIGMDALSARSGAGAT